MLGSSDLGFDQLKLYLNENRQGTLKSVYPSSSSINCSSCPITSEPNPIPPPSGLIPAGELLEVVGLPPPPSAFELKEAFTDKFNLVTRNNLPVCLISKVLILVPLSLIAYGSKAPPKLRLTFLKSLVDPLK